MAFVYQEGFAIRICSLRAKLQERANDEQRRDSHDLPSENRGMSVARRDRRRDMFFRAFIVWVALLALAIVNGAARKTWLVPRIGGPAGHAVSSLSLSAAILLLAWLTMAWIDPASSEGLDEHEDCKRRGKFVRRPHVRHRGSHSSTPARTEAA